MNKKVVSMFIFLVILLTLGVITFVLMNNQNKINNIRKSVVKIEVYDKDGEVIQTGSGFLVFKKDILITNAHVITGGNTADVINENDERITIDGALYYNQDQDIAILKLNSQNSLKPLRITTKYNVGDKVIAIGSPLGIKNTVSDGMVSNILEDKTIQHTAPISHGSSGGALFTSKGKLIGMNTATFTDGQNMNLAIPISKIKEVYNLSKNNNIKSIKEIQYLSKNVKSVMLNNQSGKEIVKIIEKNGLTITDIEEYRKAIIDSYIYAKLIDEGIIEDRIYAANYNVIDMETFEVEYPPLSLIEIIKVKDTYEEYIEEIEKEYYDRISNMKAISKQMVYNRKKEIWEEIILDFSNYQYEIGHYKNYVYLIEYSDNKIGKQIKNQIELLP